MAGCASWQQGGGMRRPTWWAFYGRGLSYGQKGRWADASAQFEIAVGTRPGAIYPSFPDRRRARTYGLHFLNDYFPHRELGVCHFQLGNFSEAEAELKRSLQMSPSARAKDYLNRVRARRLALRVRQGQGTATPPQLALARLPAAPVIRQKTIRIQGAAASSNRIASLRIGGRRVYVELARPRLTINQEVILQPGPQTVRVATRDLLGRETVWTTEVTVDLDAPRIAVYPGPSRGQVRIDVVDNLKLEHLQVDGVEMRLAGARHHSSVHAPTPGGLLKVEATDSAGHRMALELPSGELLGAVRSSRRFQASRQLASAAEPTALPRVAQDTAPPRFSLLPDPGDRLTVTTSVFVADLLVHDIAGLADVSLQVGDGPIRRQSLSDGQTYSRLVLRGELAPGQNRVVLTARDRAGNATTRILTVTRLVDLRWRDDLRMHAALMPPNLPDGFGLETDAIEERLLVGLLERPRRLRIVERGGEATRRILLEHRVNQLGGQSPAGLTNGRLAPAEWLIQGYATRWGDAQDWDLVLSLVDTATSQVVLTADVHCPGFAPGDVAYHLQGLVGKLKQRLPALACKLDTRNLREGTATVAPAAGVHLVPGMRFVFVPASRQGLLTAAPFREDGVLVQGMVTHVQEGTCTLSIQPSLQPSAGEGAIMAVMR